MRCDPFSHASQINDCEPIRSMLSTMCRDANNARRKTNRLISSSVEQSVVMRMGMLARSSVTPCGAACAQAVAGPAILPAESIGMPASAVGALAALPPQYAGNHRVRCVAYGMAS